MPTINFFIQSKNNPSGIYVRLRDGRKVDAKAKPKLSINPDDWSDLKGKPKHTKNIDLKNLDTDLEVFKTKLLNYYNKSENEITNTNWLKAFINPSEVVEIPNKLLDYFDYYLTIRGAEISPTTIKKIKVIKAMLAKLQKAIKREFQIKEVGIDFKLLCEKFFTEQKYAPNSSAKYVKMIKTICLHARIKQITTHPELDLFNARYHSIDKIYLTLGELQIIEDESFDLGYLDNARDWLLISCETGQRVSDFLRFTRSMIRYENSKPLIEFTQIKTKKIMTVPLSKRVLRILDKRDGEFPRKISDVKYNLFIKEVCKIAELNENIKGSKSKTVKGVTRKETGIFEKWELVTSHIGRRSFATNNYGIIPTSLLIGVTGHSTEKMFLEYIGKSDTQKALQLAEYF